MIRDLYWKWKFWRIERWAERNKDWLLPPPPLDEIVERVNEEMESE